MLAAVSSYTPSTSIGLSSITPQSARTLSLIILALHAISNAPTTNAMDQLGYQVCTGSCYQRYPQGSPALNQCLQNCWNTFVSAW